MANILLFEDWQTMNPQHSTRLREMRVELVSNLDVRVVIDHLLQEGIITSDDYERIRRKEIRSDSVRELLDLLPTRGPRAFDVFVTALKTDKTYSWLVDKLQEH
jgi:transcription initiation factor IIE alpha subunit